MTYLISWSIRLVNGALNNSHAKSNDFCNVKLTLLAGAITFLVSTLVSGRVLHPTHCLTACETRSGCGKTTWTSIRCFIIQLEHVPWANFCRKPHCISFSPVIKQWGRCSKVFSMNPQMSSSLPGIVKSVQDCTTPLCCLNYGCDSVQHSGCRYWILMLVSPLGNVVSAWADICGVIKKKKQLTEDTTSCCLTGNK